MRKAGWNFFDSEGRRRPECLHCPRRLRPQWARAYRETEFERADLEAVIMDMLEGQYK